MGPFIASVHLRGYAKQDAASVAAHEAVIF
jgi:hypothetical protein